MSALVRCFALLVVAVIGAGAYALPANATCPNPTESTRIRPNSLRVRT